MSDKSHNVIEFATEEEMRSYPKKKGEALTFVGSKKDRVELLAAKLTNELKK